MKVKTTAESNSYRTSGIKRSKRKQITYNDSNYWHEFHLYLTTYPIGEY